MFLAGASGIVFVLALVRCINPGVVTVYAQNEQVEGSDTLRGDASSHGVEHQEAHVSVAGTKAGLLSVHAIPAFKDSSGAAIKNRIYSVSSFKNTFPDLQDVQILAAQRWGVSPVRDREQAEQRKDELVYVGSNPYYVMDKSMSYSIPYLVPRASDLLQKISRNFLDSLAIKGIPLHKLIVTSVLRTEHDVSRLRRSNGNASEASCHRYGTTFDICYNRYFTVSHPDGPERRAVRNDSLKWVLSEVLRDVRELDMCYVKYEVKQGCFHITVR